MEVGYLRAVEPHVVPLGGGEVDLDLEAQVSALPPVALGGFVVVPAGLIARMTGRPLPKSTQAVDTQAWGARARAIILEVERQLGAADAARRIEPRSEQETQRIRVGPAPQPAKAVKPSAPEGPARLFREWHSPNGFPPRELTEQAIVQILREYGGRVRIRNGVTAW